MKLTALSAVVAVGVSVVVAAPLRGQGYNVRLDTRLQSVSLLDVNNEELAGTPLVSTLDAALWGFGIPGLSVRTRVRAVTDLRDSAAWPTTEPHLQLLEGYVDYTTNLLQAQAGRTHVVSRLGYTGFDGVRVDVRPGVAGLRATAFGGWGLARGTPLPLTTPEINPLSDFIPTERQILVGGGLGWSTGLFDANLAYQREVLPNGSEPAALASDRGAMDLVVRPARGWLVAGGAAYDFARREVNTADARVSYRDRRGKYGVSVGGRYYNPYFDLWTIWGVFNPTPYWSAFGSVQAYPVDGVQVWATGERYMYEDAEILQPIAEVDDGGWRWSAGTAITRFHPFVGGVTYYMEGTQGAASLGFDGYVMYEPLSDLTVRASGGFRRRPLEYRVNLARVWNYGLRVDYRAFDVAAVMLEARRYDEERWQADPAPRPIEFDQWRLHAGLTLWYGSVVRPSLHPAILRIPERRPR